MYTRSDQQILITGGAGFIGSNLARDFIPEHDVTVLDILTSGYRRNVPEDATFIEADIRNRNTVFDAAATADVIFHEAALVSVTASVEDPETSHAINVKGIINVLEAARQQDARVVLSSVLLSMALRTVFRLKKILRRSRPIPMGSTNSLLTTTLEFIISSMGSKQFHFVISTCMAPGRWVVSRLE
jgi:UDP-glucose 4-epimerase